MLDILTEIVKRKKKNLKFEYTIKIGIKGKKLPKISELDSRILKILLKNGRIGYDSIAKECGEPENKIWKRCKSMEKKGIIKGATVQMNFGFFGYAALATMLISAEAQQMDQVMEITKKITEVRAYRQYNSVYNVRAVRLYGI